MNQTRLRGPPVIRIEPINKCANRRFYRISLCHSRMGIRDGQIEDLGSYDPLPNKDNEILVALNINRIKEHLARKVKVSGLAAEFLGLAGLLPVHPDSYLKAYRNRREVEQAKKLNDKSNNEENS
jgi:small subunit ribosomal protein S16